LENLITLDDLPMSLQVKILSELRVLAESPLAIDATAAHAAMTISECYTVGFGASHNRDEAMAWLSKAVSRGFKKAASWYPRTCYALGLKYKPTELLGLGWDLEHKLSSLPTEQYLQSRIHQIAQHKIQQAKSATTDFKSISKDHFFDGWVYGLAVFNPWNEDELTPLHFIAWLGDDDLLKALLEDFPVDVLSAAGFTALHYACIGGHLSTVQILVEQGALVSAQGFRNITPLHLIVFFNLSESCHVANILINHGAVPDAEISARGISWEEHDIIMHGTALDWAVMTRNVPLVEILLPHSKGSECLQLAIDSFFWEILATLLDHFQVHGGIPDDVLISSIRRPFRHWIAHGQDHITAIGRTVDLCRRFHLPGYEAVDSQGYTALIGAITNFRSEDDFEVIDQTISATSPELIKLGLDDITALMHAIGQAKDNHLWTSTVQKLVDCYTVEELEAELPLSASGHLHYAVSRNSVVAARVLLQKGVNVNQPTYDGLELSPLHVCMESESSVDMYALLIEYGAKIDLRDHFGNLPLQLRLLGTQNFSVLFDKALQLHDNANFCCETLHGMLTVSMGLQENARKDGHEAFRHLLRTKCIAQHIDAVDDKGMTLIQRAAYMLHLPSVRLLLEAGADAAIPLLYGTAQVLPVQLACAVGRLSWMKYMSVGMENEAYFRHQRESAMKIALELLHWHHASSSKLFKGITPLHIASYMGIQDEIQTLRDQYNPHAKGDWPNHGTQVSSIDLIAQDQEDDLEALAAFQPDDPDVVIQPVQFSASIISKSRNDIKDLLLKS
jgi:ankyrin repeat protein